MVTSKIFEVQIYSVCCPCLLPFPHIPYLCDNVKEDLLITAYGTGSYSGLWAKNRIFNWLENHFDKNSLPCLSWPDDQDNYTLESERKPCHRQLGWLPWLGWLPFIQPADQLFTTKIINHYFRFSIQCYKSKWWTSTPARWPITEYDWVPLVFDKFQQQFYFAFSKSSFVWVITKNVRNDYSIMPLQSFSLSICWQFPNVKKCLLPWLNNNCSPS